MYILRPFYIHSSPFNGTQFFYLKTVVIVDCKTYNGVNTFCLLLIPATCFILIISVIQVKNEHKFSLQTPKSDAGTDHTTVHKNYLINIFDRNNLNYIICMKVNPNFLSKKINLENNDDLTNRKLLQMFYFSLTR